MMYDTSGMDSSTFVDILEKDWKYMVDMMKVTESPAYLHHKGKPVLVIWGADFYCSLSVISPWTVGRYSSDLEVDLYKLTMIQDLAAAQPPKAVL